MIRQFIWVLAALLTLAIIGLMIVTPTPPKDGQVPPIAIPAQGAMGGSGKVPPTD